MTYALPRSIFNLLEEAFNGDKKKSETFAEAIDENIIVKIQEKKSELRADLYNDLRAELATKEFVRAELLEVKEEIQEEISGVKQELAQMQLLIKVLIGLMIFGFTLSNPTFLELVKAIM